MARVRKKPLIKTPPALTYGTACEPQKNLGNFSQPKPQWPSPTIEKIFLITVAKVGCSEGLRTLDMRTRILEQS